MTENKCRSEVGEKKKIEKVKEGVGGAGVEQKTKRS